MSSSRISRLERQSLLDVCADVPDPLDRRGRRHRLKVILALTTAVVLAGCRTLVAVWEHVCDLGDHVLSELGVEDGQQVPCESTIRRALARVDADDFDTRMASWLTLRLGQIAGRRVIAVDGKTMRGSRTREPRAHLLAALDQASRAVIAQQRVAAKTNEIPALPTLLADHDLTGYRSPLIPSTLPLLTSCHYKSGARHDAPPSGYTIGTTQRTEYKELDMERMLADILVGEQFDEVPMGSAPLVDEVPMGSAPLVDEVPMGSAPLVDEVPMGSAPLVDEVPMGSRS